MSERIKLMRYSTSIKIKNLQRIFIFLFFDLVVILLAVEAANALRFNSFNAVGLSIIKDNIKAIIILIIAVCSSLGLFNCYVISWRYSSLRDYISLYIATTVGVAVARALSKLLILKDGRFPFSTYIIILLLCYIGFTIERFLASSVRNYMQMKSHSKKMSKKKKVLIVGAGDTGLSLIKSLQHLGEINPVAAIDDDVSKQGMRISGVPIVGNREDIEWACKENKIDEIIIAIPAITVNDKTDLITKCKKTGLKVSTVPSYEELVTGKVNLTKTREVTPQMLLGRDEQLIDGEEIFGYINDKTVLVTGGGGSIGSELCRQIVNYNPKRLIVFDIYENDAYDLQMELRKKYPNLTLDVLIGSVRDTQRIDEVFKKYKPKVVFHAAAHKHVPLMEDSPKEAIKNNVYGTYNVASACERYKAERFVLISTDKAVNPLNIMGASKRIAEMVVQQFALRQRENETKTVYAAVRFGNVLGSNGSVIPLFKKQIKEGGPVTITHPNINRFFMTIPEAVQLVMQAGAFANGGEIFILDMGEPVKIVDLAKNLIELSGLVPDVDIKIEYVGLRPGEKLYEELLLDKQRQMATKHDRIFVEPPVEEMGQLLDEIHALYEKLSCDVENYDEMTEWFKVTFN